MKLASVATDVFGKSGREMLRALIKGEESPEQMAQLARGRLRKKLEQLVLALRGRVESHHRFMLEMQLGRVEDIEAIIAIVDSKIDEAIAPHRAVVERLTTIPIRSASLKLRPALMRLWRLGKTGTYPRSGCYFFSSSWRLP